MNFWGEDTRRAIAKKYYVKGLIHTRVFNKQKIISECSKKELKIGADYYIIVLTPKDKSSNESNHLLAKDTAEQLLEFASQPKLLLFNPLINECEEDPSYTNSSSNVSSSQAYSVNNFTKLNKEAYLAVNLFILAHKISLANIKGNLKAVLDYTKLQKDIYPSLVKGFNTVLGKWRTNMKTVYETIEKEDYGKLKKYNFPLMIQTLKENYTDTKDEKILLYTT